MKNYYQALAKFKQSVPVIYKGTQGYGYKYADLPAIFKEILPILKECGLDFNQDLVTIDDKTYIETTVVHLESGENKPSICEIPRISIAKMNDYQSFGSGITYYRRYTLGVKLGLITDVDNDASGQQIKREKTAPAKKKLSTNNLNALAGLISSQDPDKNGEIWTKEKALEKFNLTPEQKKTLLNID